MNDTTDTAMRAIVDADQPHPTAPDLEALKGAGRRRLLRRRAVTGVAAATVAGVLAVPAFRAISGDGERATDPVSNRPTTAVQCGQLLCIDPERSEYSVEKAQVIGQWVGNDLGNGAEEVLYVARAKGMNMRTNEREMVDVVMSGYRYRGELHRVVWSTQPGTDATSPEGHTSQFYFNPLDGRYSVFGYVTGSPDAITWSTPDGETGPVDGVIPDALPGYTLFHVALPLPEGTAPPESEPAPKRKPGESIEDYNRRIGGIRLGDDDTTWPPELTIHTSDGWSCSLVDCGLSG